MVTSGFLEARTDEGEALCIIGDLGAGTQLQADFVV
jgi:hypothetical protein